MADIQKLNVNGNTYDISTTWDKVTGKPATFPPSSHQHEKITHKLWGYSNAISDTTSPADICAKFNIGVSSVNAIFPGIVQNATGGRYQSLFWTGYGAAGLVELSKSYGSDGRLKYRVSEGWSDGGAHWSAAGYRELANIEDLTWTNIESKPTTIAGYGITDAYTATTIDNKLSGYLPLSGGTLTGLLTTTSGNTHNGIKIGSNYINAINNDLIFQNNGAIRFGGGDSWDYNIWAGLKYVHSSKSIYLGLADGTQFTANTGQSGGKVYFPGISGLYAAAYYQSSDERLKIFYEPIKPDLEKLRKLRKNYFKFNDKDKLEIGVSAQEIQSIYPEIVSTDDNGYLSVAYDKLSVIALAAIDELDNRYKKEINDLKDQLDAIKNILNEKGIV